MTPQRRVSSSVERSLPKPQRRVRFPYPAPYKKSTPFGVLFLYLEDGRESNHSQCKCPVDICQVPAGWHLLLTICSGKSAIDSRTLFHNKKEHPTWGAFFLWKKQAANRQLIPVPAQSLKTCVTQGSLPCVTLPPSAPAHTPPGWKASAPPCRGRACSPWPELFQ